LAEVVGVTPATATRMCDRLVKKKLIVRQSEQDDRRQVRLALTKKGLKLVGTVTDRRRREIEAILSAIDPEEQTVLVQALSQFATAAGEVPEQDWSTGWTSRCPSVTSPARAGGNGECALRRCASAGGSRRRPTPEVARAGYRRRHHRGTRRRRLLRGVAPRHVRLPPSSRGYTVPLPTSEGGRAASSSFARPWAIPLIACVGALAERSWSSPWRPRPRGTAPTRRSRRCTTTPAACVCAPSS